MIFTTYWFFLFAALVVSVYWCLKLPALRLAFLGVACFVFHGHFAGPAGLLPILALMVLTYLLGLTKNRALCIAGIVITVFALCFYKYSVFLLSNVIAPFHEGTAQMLMEATKRLMPGAPPLAISFFAFEFVHYLYDISKGSEPVRNPLKFTLFAIFFPSLVAGPIKRYEQFIPALEAGARQVNSSDVAEGARRVAIGFIKKVVIADNLTLYIDHYQPQFDTLDGISRWTVFIFIALRILFDFSGYSDIAIGLARMLGVTLPENFNWPYKATSLQDFWQRWHISLSSWIRDYVYIPLGGNRLGPVRRVINGLIAFGLCGLWHGPAWNFVLWGIYHGVGLAVNSSYRAVPGIGPVVTRVMEKERWLGWVLTQAYVWFGWLLFFYPVEVALQMARKLTGV